MGTIYSKLTAQGQISIPVEVRKRLGVGPGSILEWEEQDGHMIVKKAARYGCVDIHTSIFPDKSAKPAGPVDVKEGIRKHIRKRHARD